jgi:hypothetical protein
MLFNVILWIRDVIADLFGLFRNIIADWWDYSGRTLIATIIVVGIVVGLMVRHTDAHDHTAPTTGVTSTTHAH